MSVRKVVNPDLIKIPQMVFRTGPNGEINAQTLQDLLQNIATTTPSYREGSFVGTLAGCTTAPTQTYNYIKIANFVQITPAGNLLGLSNSTACSITGLPSFLETRSTIYATDTFIQSSGNYEAGTVQFTASSGTINLVRASGSLVFVNDNLNKGLGSGAFCYSIAN